MSSTRQYSQSQVEYSSSFSGAVGIMQRVLPVYRAPFFAKLDLRCQDGLEVLAGEPQPSEGIRVQESPYPAWRTHAKNLNFGDIERSAWYVCWQTGIHRWLQKLNPDVLIVNVNPRLLSNWPAIRYMAKRGKPVIGWGLGELPRTGLSSVQRLRRQLAMYQVHACDGIIAYSSKAAQDYLEMGVRPERVFTAYNAVDTTASLLLRQQLYREPTSILSRKAELADQDIPIILTVGRLLPQKRIDVLIRACASLGSACQLVVVGDGPERAALEDLAAAIFPSTKFLGYQTGIELGRTFLAANLFVLPGTGGLAVQEAMSYGKPVLVADADGTERDLVMPGKNGYLVEPGNVQQLQDLLKSLIADRNCLEKMGQASLEVVEQKINLDRMVDAFIDALHVVSSSNKAMVT